ncbi:hypothetical protein QR680_017858 [Steinernema hermaphroditum]|uniref:F-box domain-containing protein n=1 Tax=Steinernema hermaphroditum TaxID=289476 RepID=A0AA39LPF3_9BILA|nr:hypothetical protein QR680_017858 [Steinernema hermaphroditum]
MRFKLPLIKRQNSQNFGVLFENLPVDVKVFIFEKLPLADLRRCRLVCSQWNDVIYGCMKPLRIRLTINFPSEGTPQMCAVKSVTKADLDKWPTAMTVSSIVCEGFSDSYSSQWSDFICEIMEMPICKHVDELKTVNILHSELSTKKLLRHAALSKLTEVSFCDQRFTPRMISEICRFAKENPLLRGFHLSGFDVDHFEEIFDTIQRSLSVVDCTVLAKRGTCTSDQILIFLQALVDSHRNLYLHGLSIDDLQFNGAMRQLKALHRRGHHLAFFSSDPATSKPDICVVFDKTAGPAAMLVCSTEENDLFRTKFLGALIREELQTQKPYSTIMIKIAGDFEFNEDELRIDVTISGLDEPLKGNYFDCTQLERALHTWFARKFDQFPFSFSAKIDSSRLPKIGRLLPWRRAEPEIDPDSEHPPLLFWGPVNEPKVKDTLTLIHPAYRWTFANQQKREAGRRARCAHYATRVRIGINT